jgi:hypothetical protein
MSDEDVRGIEQVFIVACGSAYHSGLVGKYAIERWARIPVQVEMASEFRYRDPSSAATPWSSPSRSPARPPTRWRRCATPAASGPG